MNTPYYSLWLKRSILLLCVCCCWLSQVYAQLTVNVTKTDPTCAGYTNGSATANASNGTAPYRYAWSNGTNSATIFNLTSGIFSVTVTDAVNVRVIASVVIVQPSALNLGIAANAPCATNGGATATATGGTSPYTYSWSNGATGAIQPAITSGNYNVTATDARGCIAVNFVRVPSAMSTTIRVVGLKCFGDCDASVQAIVTGGTAPLRYAWNTGATTDVVPNLPAGTYAVTVTDANGCTSVANTTITNPTPIVVNASVVSPACGASNGSATATASGGRAPYIFRWSNGVTGATVNNLPAGVITLDVEDANNCTKTVRLNILSANSFLLAATAVNATCGSTNGSVTTAITGGNAPFTYRWSNNATTANLSNVGAGTYSVTVTDANGCVNNASVTVNAIGGLTISVTKTDAACGIANGTTGVNVLTGRAPFTYRWSNNATTPTLTGLGAGTYSVTVTDANNCTASGTVTINQTASFDITPDVRGVVCFGGNTGSIAIMIMGGSAPYSYLWTNGATTPTITNLAFGTYGVTVTDASGCTAVRNGILVTQPNIALAITATPTSINCTQAGAVSASVNGGTAPYTYRWSNNATTANISNLTNAGTYSVTVTDVNNCTAIANATVGAATGISLMVTTTNARCFGAANGSANISVTGATAPITYAWSNGANTASLNNLAAGTYSVTVTDARGCTASQTVSIMQPSALGASISATNISCIQTTGTAVATATGGTSPYTYLWNNNATTASISNLSAGNYTVTITDANGCIVSASTTISATTGVTLALTATNVRCFGGATGAISTNVTGATAPVTYAWSNGANTAAISNLAAGTYSVTATDARGCTASQSVVITQPNIAVAVATVVTSSTCTQGGTATAQPSGGTPPYSYRWSNTATTISINNLSAGSYTVTVTDANACTVSATAVIGTATGITLAVTTSNVRCFGNNAGAAIATVSGATAPITYAWSNGANTTSVSNLIAGAYSVTATDARGCTATQTFSITQPLTALTATVSTTNPPCFGGNGGAATTASGGTAPYTYLWSNGVTSPGVSGLTVGNYSLTVTDANGCQNIQSTTITQPTALAVNITSSNVLCAGGTTGVATAIASGGSPNYRYLWTTGATTQSISNLTIGNYSVTVTDANACSVVRSVAITQPTPLTTNISATNATCLPTGSATVTAAGGTGTLTYRWSNNATTSTINNLMAGNYTVTVTDANNCTTTASINITAPTGISVSVATTNVRCFGAATGTAIASVTNAVNPITYAWSNGANTASVSNLAAGTYSVTATDARNCVSSQTISITQPAAALTATATNTNITCLQATGTATVTALGGTAPYTYRWSNNATTAAISGLTLGTYSVTVTDANACTANASITVSATAGISVAVTTTNVRCFGGSTGTAVITITNGVAPFTYVWAGGISSPNLNALAAGTYSFTVTDSRGCSAAQSFTITQPTVLSASINTNNPLCFGGTGGATAVVSGGTTPYSYLWGNGSINSAISGLVADSYGVTINDANACQIVQTFSITQPTALVANASATNILCNGASTGTATVTASGGSPNYAYNWSNGATTQSINNLPAASYSVTVNDANNCSVVRNVTVAQPTAINVTVSTTNATCLPVGTASVTATGGTGVLTYRWSNGATTAVINNLSVGNYIVTVTDANNCTAVRTANVGATISPNLSVAANVTREISLAGLADGEARANASNGAAPYSYRWNTGVITPTISNLGAGTYTVTVTDANGCVAVASVTLIEPPCTNVTNNGTIGSNEVLCIGEPISDILELTPATGGVGTLQYLWLRSFVNSTVGSLDWQEIPNSNSPNLTNIGTLSRTTYFARCVRRSGCGLFLESNVVIKQASVEGNYNAPSSGCVGQLLTFTALDVQPVTTYNWFFGGSAAPTSSNAQSVQVRFQAAGNYTINLGVLRNGCFVNRAIPIQINVCLNGGVGFMNFQAKPNSPTAVQLNWTAEESSPNSTYYLERSADGQNFTQFQEMPAKNGTINTYAYVDQLAKKGKNFYRLKNVSTSGLISNSEVRMVKLYNDSETLLAYPNPTNSVIYFEVLDSETTEGTLQIFDEVGRAVLTQTVAKTLGRTELDVTSLNRGFYTAKMILTDGAVKTAKFVKQ